MSSSDTSVRSSWARIDAWLQRFSPASIAELAPPATHEEIESAQTRIGLRFPAEFLDSLACHNGAERYSRVLPFGAPLSLVEAVEFWRTRVKLSEEDVDPQESYETVGEPWWHRSWIPWAETDGDAQIIDMRRGPEQGRMGTAPRDDCAEFGGDWGWPSLGSYLFQVAETLESGGNIDESAPYLTPDGGLVWETPYEAEFLDLIPVSKKRNQR
ncbi:SMI1/KNR4 family protein [Streptomyces sp. NPDC002547]